MECQQGVPESLRDFTFRLWYSI